MYTWLKKIFGVQKPQKPVGYPYLETFSDLCEKLEKEGISSRKYSVFNMARYEFGQFNDLLINDNMHDALDKLSKFNHKLEDLVKDINNHGQMTPAIANLLQQLKNLSAQIVKDFINKPEV